MQVCALPIHISPDMPVGLCSRQERLWVCDSACQPVKKCACVCARVLHTSRAPCPPISSSLPANPQQTLPALLGICQLMAGSLSWETTLLPCSFVSHKGSRLQAPGSRLPPLNGSPGSQRTTFLIARDACGYSTNTTVAIRLGALEQGCVLRLCEFSVPGS